MKLRIAAVLLSTLASPGAINAQCGFCPDGITARADDPTADIPESGGQSCNTLADLSLTLMEGSDECKLLLAAEMTCCPSDDSEGDDFFGNLFGGDNSTDDFLGGLFGGTTSDNPCTICPDGITVDGSTDLGEGATCDSTIADAVFYDEGGFLCSIMKEGAEMICCPSLAENPCPICTDGITINEDTPIAEGGETCADLVASALNFEEDGQFCGLMKESYEMICCPTPHDNPCTICPGSGITVGQDTVIPNSGGRTCQDLVASMAAIDAESETCAGNQSAANFFCCPGQVAVADACPVCTEGGVDEDFEIPESDGMTCGDVIAFAANIEASDMNCEGMRGTEIYCCPDSMSVAENPCQFCSDGLAVDGSTIIPDADGATCALVVDHALNVEESSEMCSEMKGAELVCCPTPAENPCPFCSNGLTVDESTIVPGSDGTTCGLALEYALTVEESSETCSELKGAEAFCCGTPAENPCILCSNGLTVDESTEIPGSDGTTCGFALELASSIEESADLCPSIKSAEAFCCPNPAENPCPFCSNGLTVDGSTAIPSDDDGVVIAGTCALALETVSNMEESSEFCPDIQRAEAVCCPPSGADTSSTMPSEVAVAPGTTSSTESTQVSSVDETSTTSTAFSGVTSGPTQATEIITTVGPTVTAESAEATLSPTPTVPSTGVHVSATTGFILAFAAICVQATMM